MGGTYDQLLFDETAEEADTDTPLKHGKTLDEVIEKTKVDIRRAFGKGEKAVVKKK